MLNIVIPMAGHGSRFAQVGYQVPKPLIPIYGFPMIQVVINNLTPRRRHRFVFICQRQHLDNYPLREVLETAAPQCTIIGIDGVTAGAACTVLLACDHFDNERPLMIANCDQWINYDIDRYLNEFDAVRCDGWIMTMKADSPKWSYVERSASGRVERVVEKEVVSAEATVGIYNFRRGADFVVGASAMIEANERSKGEFYVAPVYSRLIRSGYAVETCLVGSDVDGMHGLGTPADLEHFLTLGYEDEIRRQAERVRRAA
jgi:dTDP-glucose pyrophosphorylase